MDMVPCHIVVDGNPAILYTSRNGSPAKVLPTLTRFLDKFWQERDTSGETSDTPECLLAQIVVRFGFELCEDDFSNLRVGLRYHPNVEYLYLVKGDRTLSVYVPDEAYRQNPALGLAGCHEVENNSQPVHL